MPHADTLRVSLQQIALYTMHTTCTNTVCTITVINFTHFTISFSLTIIIFRNTIGNSTIALRTSTHEHTRTPHYTLRV